MTLTVTVLVPAHNEAATIEQVVRSCWDQTYRPETVVVIDDGSTDGTAQLARAAGAQVLVAPGGSKSYALNLGLKQVTTDLVVGVDGDTLLAKDAINELVATMEQGYDGTCAAVLPQQRTGLFVRARKFEYVLARRWLKPVQNAVGRLHVASGAAFCYRTAVLRAIGGIPVLPIGEDTNLTWTLQGAGYRIGYSPRAVAYTREPETLKVYVKQIRRWSSSNVQTIARHRGQLRNPRRLLVVGCGLWDLVTVSLSWAVLIWSARQFGTAGLGLFGLLALALHLSTFVLVVRDLGLPETTKCFAAHLVVAPLTRWIYLWSLIREWIFGRHYASWTGRQGHKTVITPMTARRKLALTSISGVLGAGLALGGRPAVVPVSPVPPVLAAEPFPSLAAPAVEPLAGEPTHEKPSAVPALVPAGPSPAAGQTTMIAAGPNPVAPAPIVTAEQQETASQYAPQPASEARLVLAAPAAPTRTPKSEPDTTPEPTPAPEPTPDPTDKAEPASEGKTEPEQEETTTPDASTETDSETTATQTEQT